MQHKDALTELATMHTALTAQGWQLESTESKNDGVDITEQRVYTGTAQLTTAGDGYWDAAAGIVVAVTEISIVYSGEDGSMFKHVAVTHDSDEQGFRLYSDTGISTGVSELLGMETHFTESGMQDEYMLSME